MKVNIDRLLERYKEERPTFHELHIKYTLEGEDQINYSFEHRTEGQRNRQLYGKKKEKARMGVAKSLFKPKRPSDVREGRKEEVEDLTTHIPTNMSVRQWLDAIGKKMTKSNIRRDMWRMNDPVKFIVKGQEKIGVPFTKKSEVKQYVERELARRHTFGQVFDSRVTDELIEWCGAEE